MSRYRLIVDERERNTFPTLRLEMEACKNNKKEIDFEIKTISVGDYAIIDNKTEKLVASFERKTLDKDFPASIKDGRYANKEKMISARKKTGCRLYYIVEGDISPPQEKMYSGIPYKLIESAIFHLEMRDGFHIMRTKDTVDTIRTLIRLIYSIETINPVAITDSVENENNRDESKGGGDEGKGGGSGGDGAEEDITENNVNAMTVLTEKHVKKDIDILREAWACFKGISTTSADMFISQFSLKEIIRGEIGRDVINSLKTPAGRAISKSVKQSLNVIETSTCERILSKVPGISATTAKELIKSAGSLHTMLSYDSAAISIMKIGAKKKNLGASKAEKITEIFNMKMAAPN